MFGSESKIDVGVITEEMQAYKAYVVDVRENDEWDDLHVQGALHLSIGRIMNGEVPIKDPSKKLYLYCASGGRAAAAAMKLQASGYVVESLGGLDDWQSAGGATESGM